MSMPIVSRAVIPNCGKETQNNMKMPPLKALSSLKPKKYNDSRIFGKIACCLKLKEKSSRRKDETNLAWY